jgi:diguanylate cyclase (GGDEF)-like protein/PAS domain S-box-containing protein
MHFVQGLLPGVPPDALPLRLLAAGISASVAIALLLFPRLRRYSADLQLVNILPLVLMDDVLLVNSGILMSYVAGVLLIAVVVQQAFNRSADLVIVASTACVFEAIYAASRGVFFERTQLLILATMVSVYIVSTTAGVLRIRTQQRLLEKSEELRVAIAQKSRLLESASDAVLVADSSGCIVSLNEQAETMFGYLREDLVGQKVDMLVPHRPRVAFEEGVATELLGKRKDGIEFSIELRLSPISADGQMQMIHSVRDISERRAFEAALAISSERFRTLFEQNPNAVASIDADGNFSSVNPEYERISGYRASELVGQHFTMLVPPQRRTLAVDRISQSMTAAASFEAVMLCKDGTETPIRTDASPIRIGGEMQGVIVTTRDLTNERALDQRLREKDERVHGLYLIVSSAREASSLIDEALDFAMRALGMPYGFVTHVTGGTFTVLHRLGPGDVLAVGVREPVVSSVGVRLAASPHAIAIEDLSVEPYASELRERGLPWKSYIGCRIIVENVPYGALIFMDETVREKPFERADLDFVNLMSLLIGAAVAREIRHAQLEDLAFHDGLTGIANRRVLEDHVLSALSYAKRANNRIAIHYIDLDRFKPINDLYGHAAGDEVLCEVARRLSSVLREHDLLARVGGDEFVAVQTVISDGSAVDTMSRRLAESLQGAIALSSGNSVTVGASIGAASYPEAGKTLDELLAVADAAMMREKRGHHAALR